MSYDQPTPKTSPCHGCKFAQMSDMPYWAAPGIYATCCVCIRNPKVELGSKLSDMYTKDGARND